MQDPMGDHADVVAIDERDRADDLSARFLALPAERVPYELPQRLGAARESFGADEPIEVVEELPLERDADAVHGHVLPPTTQVLRGSSRPRRTFKACYCLARRVTRDVGRPAVTVLRCRSIRSSSWSSPLRWGSNTATTRTTSSPSPTC